MTNFSMSDPDLPPFVIVKSAEETNGEFVRFESTLYPAPGTPTADLGLSHSRWAADNAGKHLHPNQTERLKVLSGTYNVVIGDEEHTLTAGDEITTPPNTPHRHWNPSDKPVRMIKEDRPARNSEPFFCSLYALAQNGQTDADGMPKFLQFAVLQDEYPGHAYLTNLPVGLQKTLFSLLAPLGRSLGYDVPIRSTDAPDWPPHETI